MTLGTATGIGTIQNDELILNIGDVTMEEGTNGTTTFAFDVTLNQASIDEAATFNGTPYLVAATLFVLVTIPLARFTDWLVARDRRKRQAAGVA